MCSLLVESDIGTKLMNCNYTVIMAVKLTLFCIIMKSIDGNLVLFENTKIAVLNSYHFCHSSPLF